MSTQESTAIIAIIIASIAFFITVAQLLQQLFGTAVGYRNCQVSVIGDWAQLTKRKWRWSEFRFETKFSTPHIQVLSVGFSSAAFREDLDIGKLEPNNFILLTNYPESRHVTLMGSNIEMNARYAEEDMGDLVGWIALIDRLHKVQGQILPRIHIMDPSTWVPTKRSDTQVYTRSRKNFDHITSPTISVRQRSWDFVPPDIIRPFASSTIGDIIVMAHRLGMEWKDMRPDEGVMRAEGNGLAMNSTSVRAFGILLQITQDLSRYQGTRYPGRNFLIPTREVDKLGFRIIPGCPILGLPDYYLDGGDMVSSILGILEDFKIPQNICEEYADFVKRNHSCIGFSDLLALVAPFMPLAGSSITQIPLPYPGAQDSPIKDWDAFWLFRHRLETWQQPLSHQMEWVLSEHQRMYQAHPSSWDSGHVEPNQCSVEYVNDCSDLWWKTTECLLQLSRGRFDYSDLVAAHITQVIQFPTACKQNNGERSKNEAAADELNRLQAIYCIDTYISHVEEIVKFMRKRNKLETRDRGPWVEYDRAVQDDWWTMMLRAMCWYRGVDFQGLCGDEGQVSSQKNRRQMSVVSPSLYRSQMPVYIT